MVNTQHKNLRSIKAKLALALIKHQFIISTVNNQQSVINYYGNITNIHPRRAHH